jgi:serine/threonine-protein kinase RsbW
MAVAGDIGSKAHLELVLASRLDEIARLATAVESFCEVHALPARSAHLFNLCFDELITNIVIHGLKEAPDHAIAVTLELRRGWVRGTIVDDGPPFDPLGIAPPDLHAALEDRAIGGLGTHFVRTLMDEVGYRYQDGHNHFMLAHQIPGRAVPGEK